MKSILLLTVLAATGFLSSCNTTIGFGRDLRILGENMETQANKSRGGGSASEDTSGAPVY